MIPEHWKAHFENGTRDADPICDGAPNFDLEVPRPRPPCPCPCPCPSVGGGGGGAGACPCRYPTAFCPARHHSANPSGSPVLPSKPFLSSPVLPWQRTPTRVVIDGRLLTRKHRHPHARLKPRLYILRAYYVHYRRPMQPGSLLFGCAWEGCANVEALSCEVTQTRTPHDTVPYTVHRIPHTSRSRAIGARTARNPASSSRR